MATYTIKFTKRTLDAIKPSSARDMYRDTERKGLVLICYPTGKKTFFKRRSINNRDEKVLLGEYTRVFGPDEARLAADQFEVAISSGHNPAEAKRQIKDEPTLQVLFDEYLAEHKTKSGKPLAERTKAEYKKIWDSYFRKISEYRHSQVDEAVALATLKAIKAAPASQIKAASILSVVLDHWLPGSGKDLYVRVKRTLPKLDHRERYLTDEETERFLLAVENNPYRDFFLLALLTGQRRSNVQAMRWVDIDLDCGRWRLDRTETKNRQTHFVDLPPEAVEILKTRKAEKIVNAVWVFPADSKSGHLEEPRKAWERLLREADIENLRLHDLRHTLASWLINSGHSIDVVGRALGHKSNAASRIYAHLTRETVGKAVADTLSRKMKR